MGNYMLVSGRDEVSKHMRENFIIHYSLFYYSPLIITQRYYKQRN